MSLSPATFEILRVIIRRLYDAPFCESLFNETAKAACAVMDAQYFSLFLLQQAGSAAPLFFSNNPPDFVPVYLSVSKDDFLIRGVIETGGSCVLKRMHDYDVPENRKFIDAVQRARPISDVAYLPLMRGDTLWGYFAVARADLGRPAFSDEELHVFRFITSFIQDAFERSIAPPWAAEDEAYLDFEGNVLAAGDRIGAALKNLLGDPCIKLGSARSMHQSRLRAALREFLLGAPRPGMDRLRLSDGQVSVSLAFSLHNPTGIVLFRKDVPCASVRLVDEAPRLSGASGLDAFPLSARERQVVRGIFACKSNKAIAADLRIDESTVKRYTHNIYEKTGFKTRVELVLGLPPP
jgi:DNA-binding CsgD family transcriptional regulator